MADLPSKPSNLPATPAEPAPRLRLVPQVRMMSHTFWDSPQRNKILLLGLALVVVIGTTAFGQVRLNAWNQPFYDALSHKNLHGFLAQLVVFGLLAGGLLVLNVAQGWLSMTTKVSLREGLVRDLFNEWLKPRRAFHLVNAGEWGAIPTNASMRMRAT
jgi:vitamin B12/bleomycin/antimicrobial peptide transport system ATP-binding/permease protein